MINLTTGLRIPETVMIMDAGLDGASLLPIFSLMPKKHSSRTEDAIDRGETLPKPRGMEVVRMDRDVARHLADGAGARDRAARH